MGDEKVRDYKVIVVGLLFQFAEQATGKITIMLNATSQPIYSPNTYVCTRVSIVASHVSPLRKHAHAIYRFFLSCKN